MSKPTVTCEWWTDEGGLDRAAKVNMLVSTIWRDQRPYRDQMMQNLRMYGDLHVTGLSPRAYRNRPQPGVRALRLTKNVLRNVVDTYNAMRTKDKPKITCLTTDGDWDLQQKAKKRETFIDGCWYETNFHQKAFEVCADEAKCSIGWMFFYENDGGPDETKLGAERAMPWEVVIDDQDATYREPQSLHRVKWVDRGALIKRYPALEDKLRAASAQDFDEHASASEQTQAVDLVPAIESWHLPSWTQGDGEEEPRPVDGRHSYVCGAAILFDDTWEEGTFPCEPLFSQRPTTGMWGCSLVEQLTSQQREYNVINAKIQRSFHLLSAGHWIVPRGSKINTNKMDNQIGSIIETSGENPTFIAVDPVGPSTYQYADQIEQSMYSNSGVSPQLAQGQKPAGLDSGEAQRVHADIAAARFEPVYREYQDFYMRCAKQFMALSKRVHARLKEEGKRLEVRAQKRGVMTTIDFDDIDAPTNANMLRLYPTNQLPDDPEGKLAFAQELVNSGMLPDKAAAMRLLDFPDLAEASTMQDASYNAAMWCIDGILYDGVYRAPISLLDPNETKALCVASYLVAWRRGCPQDRLNDLLRWYVQLNDLSTAAPAGAPSGAPPAAAAPAPPPQAPPMAA